ncbi:hypothetical protein TEA_016116 [Camellia sinensis var. sinensis]|uniref:Carrier domain-containing protein n=1 Tax=Camellia sinensis var. sinensis TaxID=542762 RepID=A0A4S4CZ12_CAMSN|nr:hypothetical protein TEA_016116 [Camellia sinensis var. sinensis]
MASEEEFGFEIPDNEADKISSINLAVDFIAVRVIPWAKANLKLYSSGGMHIAWAPHSSCPICPAGDDSQALLWDLSSIGQPLESGLDPILAYTAGADIEQLQWSSSQPDWVAIAFSTQLLILRILPLTHVTHTVLLASSIPIRQLIDNGHQMVDETDKAKHFLLEQTLKHLPHMGIGCIAVSIRLAVSIPGAWV